MINLIWAKRIGLVIVWFFLGPVTIVFAASLNPHRLKTDNACNLCHDSPEIDRPERLCSSCHPCRQPESVLDCLKCHEHHGTKDITGLLKKDWSVREIARSSKNPHNRKGDCLVCHLTRPSGKEASEFKFGGDIDSLCRDCHIRTCNHPVGITIPDHIKKPKGLTLKKGKIVTCATCHRPNCQGDGSIFLVGFSRKKSPQTNELCCRCHQLSVKNPHVNITHRQNCRSCHAFFRQEGKREMDYSFLTDPRMVCLRCHPERPHPTGDDHRQVFPLEKRAAIRNLKLDSFGRISCTTCHDPHSNFGSSCRTRASCIDCHRDYF